MLFGNSRKLQCPFFQCLFWKRAKFTTSTYFKLINHMFATNESIEILPGFLYCSLCLVVSELLSVVNFHVCFPCQFSCFFFCTTCPIIDEQNILHKHIVYSNNYQPNLTNFWMNIVTAWLVTDCYVTINSLLQKTTT